jgi:hypothetical protein
LVRRKRRRPCAAKARCAPSWPRIAAESA